ncbi:MULTISPECIES: metal-sulfur cluster assembly factor [unclassified Lentimicrobium]|uniref:metal-sulfur cluster assembly factor n=1 Tax=unclassified Lentimicrobium TaxID=2677434 RepID=UPI001556F60F|nr:MULTISPECIES: metal-sulfur cluster assembly factor [unclassified Lentimicrobium]NPD44378.1 metal-sulfur cluster assembly factor [Lentimicrobium sp. S6]NPD86172.1 metal-sulfur cluster assembly factor [Lentimicrobium sp. L6]
MLDNLTKTEQNILNQIKTVIDPEVAINIVDLGLIYEIHHQEDEKKIQVIMTLSARGCPVGDTIINHVKTVIENEYSEYEVQVDLVWEPQWTPSMITDEGKSALNQ